MHVASRVKCRTFKCSVCLRSGPGAQGMSPAANKPLAHAAICYVSTLCAHIADGSMCSHMQTSLIKMTASRNHAWNVCTRWLCISQRQITSAPLPHRSSGRRQSSQRGRESHRGCVEEEAMLAADAAVDDRELRGVRLRGRRDADVGDSLVAEAQPLKHALHRQHAPLLQHPPHLHSWLSAKGNETHQAAAVARLLCCRAPCNSFGLRSSRLTCLFGSFLCGRPRRPSTALRSSIGSSGPIT